MTLTEAHLSTECATRLADDALATNWPKSCDNCRMIAVPDTVIAEGCANGETVPDTWRLIRPDGRVAYFFADPRDEVPT